MTEHAAPQMTDANGDPEEILPGTPASTAREDAEVVDAGHGEHGQRLTHASRAKIVVKTLPGIDRPAMAAVGLLVAWLVGRYLNRVTLGRGPEQIAEQFLLAETAMDSLEAGVDLRQLVSVEHTDLT
mgnify:CR=1 FL=1